MSATKKKTTKLELEQEKVKPDQEKKIRVFVWTSPDSKDCYEYFGNSPIEMTQQNMDIEQIKVRWKMTNGTCRWFPGFVPVFNGEGFLDTIVYEDDFEKALAENKVALPVQENKLINGAFVHHIRNVPVYCNHTEDSNFRWANKNKFLAQEKETLLKKIFWECLSVVNL